MKHTPGPWKILAFVPDERYEIATADSTQRIYRSVATVTFGYSEPAETEQHANAKLIAAAPELLEALKEVLPLVRHTDDAGWEVMKRARMAVEKAS